MKKQTQQIKLSIKRIGILVAIAALGVQATSGIAFAVVGGGQVQYRSIQMSDNGASGGSITTGVGSGTNVTYRVTFRAATNYTLRGVVLDFCAGTGGTPFIGDATCAPPPNFTVGTTPVVDTSDYTYTTGGSPVTFPGLGTTGDWTTSSTNSGQTFKMTNTTGVALTTKTTSAPADLYTFAISGVQNTSSIGTFYARLITYSTATGSIDTYNHATPGDYQDYGGFALSTAQIVEVTAKVQETMTFCVSGTMDTVNQYPNTQLIAPEVCTSTTPPAITLGHGTNNTLDSSQIDKNTVWSLASTNALRGITIRMHNSNQCGGLSTDGGVTCLIPGVGPGTAANIRRGSTPTVGAAMFGMFCYDSPAGPIGSGGNIVVVGSALCDANYRDSAHTTFNNEATGTTNDMYFGMDTSTLGNNVSSTFGDVVAASTEPVSNVLNRYDFAATASDTTPAGIYKANLAMIATGTF